MAALNSNAVRSFAATRGADFLPVGAAQAGSGARGRALADAVVADIRDRQAPPMLLISAVAVLGDDDFMQSGFLNRIQELLAGGT